MNWVIVQRGIGTGSPIRPAGILVMMSLDSATGSTLGLPRVIGFVSGPWLRSTVPVTWKGCEPAWVELAAFFFGAQPPIFDPVNTRAVR